MVKWLDKVKSDGKATFLGGLSEQLRQQAVSELASGKLVSPVSLDKVCDRVIPTLRRNPLTVIVLRALRVTDGELRGILKDALTEVGVELK